MNAILTALYFAVLQPEDRVAVKPHASPVFHAIQYLMGLQTREKLEAFRAFGGAQSYPSRTKDIDDVDILHRLGGARRGDDGVCLADAGLSGARKDLIDENKLGRLIALVGDAEMDEGNIFECLLEGYKHSLRNTWWIIDYNRQSLDGVIREGLKPKFESVFRACGWDVVTLKYGRMMEAAFARPGGEQLRDWIDNCAERSLFRAYLSGRQGMARAAACRSRPPVAGGRLIELL